MLFALLFGVSLFSIGLLSLLSGPVATEAAPPGLVASAIGFVSGVGETFGGGVAPVIAGFIAQRKEAELSHVAFQHHATRRLHDRAAIVAHLRFI